MGFAPPNAGDIGVGIVTTGIAMRVFRILGCAVMLILSAIANPAFAQQIRPSISPSIRPGPAPLIGVGIPMVGGVLSALLLARRLRRND